MVLEQFLDRKVVVRHPLFCIFLSFAYVFVARYVQELFFPGEVLATVLLVTILLVPSLNHLIVHEEKLERKGSTHFFKRHKTILKCYLGTFIGLLLGFGALGIWEPSTLAYQVIELEGTQIRPELIAAMGEYTPSIQTAMALFSHNVWFLLIGFALSIAYGSGAVFIMAFNASYFAAFMLLVWQRFSPELSLATLLHMLPESTGFILASLAGGVLSRALIHEKLRGEAFRNVLQNCFLLLLVAVTFLLVAAVVETHGTAVLYAQAL